MTLIFVLRWPTLREPNPFIPGRLPDVAVAMVVGARTAT